MEAVVIAALLLLPGAWIAFGLGDGSTRFGSRLAWAAALSPLVVAAEFFMARRAAGSFVQTAWLVAALNGPAVILIWKRWRARVPSIYENSEWEMWRGVLVYFAVAACTILPWWWNATFRAYSWHGMLHLDVIYAIAVTGTPWEAGLAGVPLSYPWAPHVAWALEGAAAQRSPTLLYPVNNLLLLAACGKLAFDLARALGASKAAATAATAFLALGPNLPGLVGWSLIESNADGPTWAVLGDVRYTPYLLKFVTFGAMPLGLALQLGVALASVHLVRRPRRQEMVLLGAGLVAMAGLYPSLFPSAAALAVGAAAVLGWRARGDEELRIPAVDVAGWAAAGLIAGYFILEGYGEGRAASPVALTPWAGLARKAAAALLGLGPFVVASWLYWRAKRERRLELAVLGIGFGGALACNLFLRLGGMNEYKFYSAAGLLVVAPAILGLETRFPAFKRRVGWVTLGSLLALGAVMLSYSRNRIPEQPGEPPELDERAFFVSLGSPRNRDGRWMAAVRVKSDPESVLVVDRPGAHVSAFAARRLLVGSEADHPHPGCNQPSRFNLVDLRGYDPAIVDRRLALLDRIYRPASPQSAEAKQDLLEAVAAEAGPRLLFAFLPGDDRAFLKWLREERRARVIYDDGERTVVEP